MSAESVERKIWKKKSDIQVLGIYSWAHKETLLKNSPIFVFTLVNVSYFFASLRFHDDIFISAIQASSAAQKKIRIRVAARHLLFSAALNPLKSKGGFGPTRPESPKTCYYHERESWSVTNSQKKKKRNDTG